MFLTGDVAITSITLAELLAGVRRLPDGRRKDELAQKIEEAVAPYRGSRSVLAFDDDAAERYAEVLASREAAGAAVSTADAQIAAICLWDPQQPYGYASHDVHVLARIEGRVVGHVGWARCEVSVGTEIVAVAGVGGVLIRLTQEGCVSGVNSMGCAEQSMRDRGHRSLGSRCE